MEKNYKFGLIFLCENLKRREGLKGLKVAEGLEKILYNMYKDNVGQNSKKGLIFFEKTLVQLLPYYSPYLSFYIYKYILPPLSMQIHSRYTYTIYSGLKMEK